MKYHFIRARRKKSLTNYTKRFKLLSSSLPRIIVRKTNKGIIIQAAAYSPKGDIIYTSAHSRELIPFGWKPSSNIPTAYLTGLLFASKLKKKGASDEYILDIGLYKPIKNSVLFAAAKGVADNKINLRNSIEFDESRLSGEHISSYAKSLPKDSHNQFSKTLEFAKNITDIFNTVKNKLLEK
ncbi:MAG: 50S ribosomal protein L18 [Candidatus Micrarchaeia archaeon]